MSFFDPEDRKPRRAKNIPKRVGEPRRGGGDAGAAAAEAVARSGRPEYVQVDQRATRVRPGRPEYVQETQTVCFSEGLHTQGGRPHMFPQQRSCKGSQYCPNDSILGFRPPTAPPSGL